MGCQGFEIDTTHGRINVCLISNFSISYAIENDILKKTISGILFHEYSHPVINPMIDSYVERGGELGEKLDRLYCPFIESLIEAIVIHILITKILITADMLESELNRSKKNIAQFVFEFYDLLKQYLNNRNQYKNIGDFLPELFELFKNCHFAD